MKTRQSLLLLFFFSSSIYAQNSGTDGLIIGSQVDNTYSALVINGANKPLNEYGKRDIIFNFKDAGQSIIRSYRGGSWDSFLQFWTTPRNSSVPQMRMHINHDGDIGIGTTNPLEKLDVAGKIRTEDIKLIGKIGKDLAYPFTYNGISFDQYSLGWFNDPNVSSDYGYSLWISSFGGIKFFTSGHFQIAINEFGNVGVGTANPQYKLDVNGTIRAKEIKVESTGADFVFEDSYELPTLDFVAEHIKEKKHLPGIPSAREVSREGLSLGDMNTKLLQKIEELTLYVIELKEENKAIQKRLDEFQNSNINH